MVPFLAVCPHPTPCSQCTPCQTGQGPEPAWTNPPSQSFDRQSYDSLHGLPITYIHYEVFARMFLAFRIRFSAPQLGFSRIVGLFSSIVTVGGPLIPSAGLGTRGDKGGSGGSTSERLRVVSPIRPSFPRCGLQQIPFASFFGGPSSIYLSDFRRLPLINRVSAYGHLEACSTICVSLR